MTTNNISPNRRTLLAAVPITAVALSAAACSDASEPSDAGAGTSTDASSASGSSGDVLTRTSEVPVGGGVVVGDVVVTQASAGDFAAFSTTCPHRGCAVAPKDGRLDCPCHGSEFDLDGSLVNGPATKPLTSVAVEIRGTDIVRA